MFWYTCPAKPQYALPKNFDSFSRTRMCARACSALPSKHVEYLPQHSTAVPRQVPTNFICMYQPLLAAPAPPQLEDSTSKHPVNSPEKKEEILPCRILPLSTNSLWEGSAGSCPPLTRLVLSGPRKLLLGVLRPILSGAGAVILDGVLLSEQEPSILWHLVEEEAS